MASSYGETPDPLRIVFAGTPEFAATSLAALLDSRHPVLAAYTQPDRKAGRGKKLTASPVKQLALEHGVPVEQPVNFRNEADVARLADYRPDVMVVAAYGLLLPPSVLAVPRLGCINVHASLLPRWRGAAPIHRALEAGDKETGITIMQMDAGLDTGAMLLKKSLPIGPRETGGSLHDQLAVLGGELLASALESLAEGALAGEPQDERNATYARKLDKTEARINWQQDAGQLARRIRAFNPWPVCSTTAADQVLRIWEAETIETQATEQAGSAPGTIVSADKAGILVNTGAGLLRLLRVQLPGSKPMAVADLLNSRRDWFVPGTVLGLQKS